MEILLNKYVLGPILIIGGLIAAYYKGYRNGKKAGIAQVIAELNKNKDISNEESKRLADKYNNLLS